MDIITEDTHLALAYLSAMSRGGKSIGRDAYEAFLDGPRPRAQLRSNGFTAVFAALNQLNSGVITRERESMLDFLTRVQWATLEGPRVSITEYGQRVLAEADRPRPLAEADEPLFVEIDPADGLAYVRIFEAIASQGTGMLVDSYLDVRGLLDVADISGVTRVLSGDDDRRQRLTLFSRTLGMVERALEMRVLPRTQLHDRFFISDTGPVLIFGSSLNSITRRPGVVTPIADERAATAIRESYDALWSGATAIEPVTSDDPVVAPSSES